MQGPNRYAYVGDNPETRTDPTGTLGCSTSAADGMCNPAKASAEVSAKTGQTDVPTTFDNEPGIAIPAYSTAPTTEKPVWWWQTPVQKGDYYYFVHGTTVGFGGIADVDSSLGGGELGEGFYVFSADSHGIQAAKDWANIKAKKEHRIAYIITFKIKVSDYDQLTKLYVPPESLDTVYRRYSEHKKSGYDVIISPTGTKDVNGIRVPNNSLPYQYKFEVDISGLFHFVSTVPANLK